MPERMSYRKGSPLLANTMLAAQRHVWPRSVSPAPLGPSKVLVLVLVSVKASKLPNGFFETAMKTVSKTCLSCPAWGRRRTPPCGHKVAGESCGRAVSMACNGQEKDPFDCCCTQSVVYLSMLLLLGVASVQKCWLVVTGLSRGSQGNTGGLLNPGRYGLQRLAETCTLQHTTAVGTACVRSTNRYKKSGVFATYSTLVLWAQTRRVASSV
jgi:hypothetical protein